MAAGNYPDLYTSNCSNFQKMKPKKMKSKRSEEDLNNKGILNFRNNFVFYPPVYISKLYVALYSKLKILLGT